jgi:hypothetical protein
VERVVRGQDAENYVFVYQSLAGAHPAAIYKRVAGVNSIISTISTYTPGDTFKCVVAGQTYDFFKNGTHQSGPWTVTEIPIVAGYVGFYSSGLAGQSTHFPYISVHN